MNWFKRYYNKKSSKKHGWHPSWFASYLSDFNEELQNAIIKFQVEHDLVPDGLVGPMTFRRLFTNHELEIEEEKSENHILINGEQVPIDWDVCTSAASCKKVLEKRNISTHFCIDNDGVIFQYLDPNDIGWHAGKVNNYSIGVDFSNAYYTKYNSIYKKRGFSERPVLENSTVHGVKLKPHLGYYKVQIEAYKQLIKTLCEHYEIPLVVPTTESGDLITKVHDEAARGKFDGVVCHYHLTRGKIDCAGLELKKIVDSLY